MIAQNDISLDDYIHSLESLSQIRLTDITRWINSPEQQFEILTKSKNPDFILKGIDNLALTLFFIRSVLLSWGYQPDTDPFEEPFLGYSVLEERDSPVAKELRLLAETLQNDPFEWTWRKYQILKELYVSLWTRIINCLSNQKNTSKTVIEHLLASHYGNLTFLAANVYHFFQVHPIYWEGRQKDLFHDLLNILSILPESTDKVKAFITRRIEKLERCQALSHERRQTRDVFTSPPQHLLPSKKWENKVIVVGIRFNSLEVFLDVAVTEPVIANEITITDKNPSNEHANFFSASGREIVLETDQISWEELEKFMKNHGYMNSPLPDTKDWKLVERLTKWLAARCMILLDSWISNQPLQLILVLERSISTDFSPFRPPTSLNLKFLARIGHKVLGLVEELSSRWNPLVKVEHVDVEPRWDTCPLCHRPIDEAHLIQLQPNENVSPLATILRGEDEIIQVHVIRKLTEEMVQGTNQKSRGSSSTSGTEDLQHYLIGDLTGTMVLRVNGTKVSKKLQVGKSYLMKGAKVKMIGKCKKIIELNEIATIIPLPHVLPHVNTHVNLSEHDIQ